MIDNVIIKFNMLHYIIKGLNICSLYLGRINLRRLCMDVTKAEVLEAISSMSVMEIVELIGDMESSEELLGVVITPSKAMNDEHAFKEHSSTVFISIPVIESEDKNDDENDP